MTEAEWLGCTDPRPMLEFLRGKVSDRKLRLFAVGCCRRVWHLLRDERSRRAIHVVECHAEGLVPKKTLKAARRQTFRVRAERPNLIGHDHRWGPDYAEGATDGLTLGPHEAAVDTANHAAIALAYGPHGSSEMRGGLQYQASFCAERGLQALLLRCIVGPLPFHPMTLDSTCLTSTVTNLAHGIYDERAFDRLPILADALEDAGCQDADILGHCREQGSVHVRGCWVVDMLTGRS